MLPSDPRLASMFKALLANESDSIPLDVLLDIALLGGQTVLSALTGKMVVPDFARFRDECKLIFDDLAKMTGGNVASYIPQLAKMPPGKFAVAVTTVDGQQFSFGDSSDIFGLVGLKNLHLLRGSQAAWYRARPQARWTRAKWAWVQRDDDEEGAGRQE